MAVTYRWRGPFESVEVDALHGEAFGHPPLGDDWRGQVERHSLGWVCARDDAGEIVGFANVPWDGGIHAFLVDVIVAANARRRGIATRMVELAAEEARAAGCEWLHVDFEDDLAPFYFDACGFTSASAGVIALR